MYQCSRERMEEKIKTFSKIGDAGHGGITRYSLSEEALEARREFVRRMEAIGAEITTDDMANVYATIPGSEEGKRICMGSHADSVKNGGNYDGILGVMSAMEVLETVVEKKIPHKDLGVVDCVLGMYHYRVRFYGQTTHAGTFPMPKRKDAFFAAAKALSYLHEKIDALEIENLVYTTGEVVCHPNINTCVPDYFDFSFDVRHEDSRQLDKVPAVVKSLKTMEFCGCRCEVEKIWKRDTVWWNEKLVGYVKEVAEEMEIKHQFIHSGAGHDAQFISYMVPTTMIFAPSVKGLSHCEDEYTSVEHCTLAASVMLNAVLKADSEGV